MKRILALAMLALVIAPSGSAETPVRDGWICTRPIDRSGEIGKPASDEIGTLLDLTDRPADQGMAPGGCPEECNYYTRTWRECEWVTSGPCYPNIPSTCEYPRCDWYYYSVSCCQCAGVTNCS